MSINDNYLQKTPYNNLVSITVNIIQRPSIKLGPMNLYEHHNSTDKK